MTDKQRLAKVRQARAAYRKTTRGYTPGGVHWRRVDQIMDELEHDLAPSRVPTLGPVVAGGKSVLLHDLTHETSGLDGYPAFDDGFQAGKEVLAPEALTVTRQSSARRRDGRPNGKAFYATGTSGIKWWFGHTDIAPLVGAAFRKGQRMCRVSGNHEAPHLHVGIDAQALIGHELIHHTDYTHGAPTVGAQLAQALET